MLKKKAASISYAFNGFVIAFREEFNFKIQISLGILAFVFGVYFRISTIEWLFVIGASGMVLSSELLNTALEELCDMLQSSHDPHVAKIKDLAAAAVLLSSTAAFIVGLIIFVPKILAL